MMMLIVKNKGKYDFSDRYNGVDFHFPAGASVALPEDAARHIFGMGVADKTETLTRLGWMRSSADLDKAMKRLGEFVFSTADQLTPGEVVSKEQGSAPLQSEPAAEPVSDGPGEVVGADPIGEGQGKRKSILDKLSGS